MSTLLTIAIPTFNRGAYIAETLDCVIGQIPSAAAGQIEILISDNGSLDNTADICQRLADQHAEWIRYVRHEENIWYDRNVDSLFENATGRYVLLLGDDDYPLPGAIQTLFEFLLAEGPSPLGLVYCYHQLIDTRTGKKLHLKEQLFQRPESLSADSARYASGIELLRTVDAPLNGGLTGSVFLRSAWLGADRSSFIGTNFIQLAVAYQVAFSHSIHVFYLPMFVVRMQSEHRWPVNGELYFGLLKAGLPLSRLYPADIVARIHRRNEWAVRRAIIAYRGSAADEQSLVEAIKDSLDRKGLGYWLLDWPLIVVPAVFLRLICKVWRLRQPLRHLSSH